MKQVVVETFGEPEVLELRELPTPEPKQGEVRVRLTSIGMNYAELMSRKGAYKIASGEPPFCPGLEGGGIIEAVGGGIDPKRIGERVILSPEAPRLGAGYGGTYRTHYIVRADWAMPAPDAIPDDQLGAIWLPYLTAWGCLVWQQQLQPGQVVALPAASSGVAMAAAQIVKKIGGTTIGMTSSEHKVEKIKNWPGAVYDHLIVTHNADRTMRKWNRELKEITNGHGVDVFFDPVASGEYLNTEIRSLAKHGSIWVYGLLGTPDTVNVTPLIRLHAAIRGWALTQLVQAGEAQWRPGCESILADFEAGTFTQTLGGSFPLDKVRQAHAQMEKGQHIGKLALIP